MGSASIVQKEHDQLARSAVALLVASSSISRDNPTTKIVLCALIVDLAWELQDSSMCTVNLNANVAPNKLAPVITQ